MSEIINYLECLEIPDESSFYLFSSLLKIAYMKDRYVILGHIEKSNLTKEELKKISSKYYKLTDENPLLRISMAPNTKLRKIISGKITIKQAVKILFYLIKTLSSFLMLIIFIGLHCNFGEFICSNESG